MDPLSITVGAANLANVTMQCMKKLAHLIQDSKYVDESVRGFYGETMTLESNLRVVTRTLASTLNVVNVPNLDECLRSVDNTVNQGTKIMERLLEIVAHLDPQDAPSFIRRALKQMKVDKNSAELASLRLQMLSCNSSFQTLLQAINISLSLDAQKQTSATLEESGLFTSMQALHEQIEQLRVDIREQSDAQSLVKPEAEKVEDFKLISSMQLVQSVAERVYSSASTVTQTASWIGSEDAAELSMDKKHQIDRYLLSMESSRYTDTTSSTAIGLDDFKVEQLMGMLDDIRASIPRDLSKARDLSLHALEVARTMDVGDNIVDRDNVAITLSMIYVFLGGPENLVEARKLLEEVNSLQLVNAPATHANVDKLAMLCWTLYHLQDFEKAEEYCLVYVNSTRALTETRDNMRQFYASVVLMVYIKFCQFKVVAAEDWSRMIPNAYLKEKFLEASHGDSTEKKSHGDWRMLPENEPVHAAALHSIPSDEKGYSGRGRFTSIYEIAAAGGFIGIIAMLMSKGITIKEAKPERCPFSCPQCCDTEFSSPLQIAAFHGQLAALEFMIRNTGRLDIIDPGGTCMREAIANDRSDVARWLLDNGGGDRSFYEPHLHHALRLRRLEILEMLINRGLDVEKVDAATGSPLLHLACRAHSVGVISQLLDAGAQIDRVDSSGHTPLFCALNQPITQDVLDCVCILLQRGADPDEKVPYKASACTPLQIMINEKRNPSVLQILIEAGADPMALYENGQNCFHRALVQTPKEAIRRIRILLRSNNPVDLNAKDKNGRPLMELVPKFLNKEDRDELEAMLMEGGAKKRRWWK